MAGLNLFTNNASTTLASGISAVDTSLTVSSGTGALFPTLAGSQYFYTTLSNIAGTIIEIVKVTARAGDTFTIVRGQDNTSASAYITGDKVELRLVDASLENFPQLDSTNTFSQTQTFVAPILGTPTSVTLTNATGLPISTGVSGLGTGIATFLATPSSANLISAVTDETGTGNLVFATSPTLVTPILGTPASGTLTNATGLPLTTGVTGTLPTTNGGTGLTTVGTADQLLGSNGTTLAYTKVGISNLSATGTASASTYLRGDNTWATVVGGLTQGSGPTGGSFPNSWPLNTTINTAAVSQLANCAVQNCGDQQCNVWQSASGTQTYVDATTSTMVRAAPVAQLYNCVKTNCNCNC